MIEHSIIKYTQPVPEKTTQFVFGGTTWQKETYEGYVAHLKERGFIPGAQIISKYGITGIIGEYKPFPPNGITFYNQDWPNIITINRPNLILSDIGYNEGELTLIVPQIGVAQ